MNLTTEEMNSLIKAVRADLPAGSTWQHYKGGVYKINGHNIDTRDSTVSISYHRIAGPNFSAWDEEFITFVRPYSEWHERVLHSGDYTPVHYGPRFKRVKYIEVPTYVDYDER